MIHLKYIFSTDSEIFKEKCHCDTVPTEKQSRGDDLNSDLDRHAKLSLARDDILC